MYLEPGRGILGDLVEVAHSLDELHQLQAGLLQYLVPLDEVDPDNRVH